ncbi:immunoglobulin-like domain-containing protein [Marinomonas mediterranea]|uniref:immunoglobulin-like domain-containing protein n=1 Tax=Marinomonas mediterranea TaxID=119864 RepID=UPI003AF00CC0
MTDTTDDTTVSLSATGSITEAGGTVTYTAELTSAAEGDVTVTLSNGETITIADGETQGTVDVVVAADEDVYVDADSISASISGGQAATSRTWWLIARQQRLKSQIPQTIRRLA